MSYLVLARKWRPKTFEALVGQQHVLRALENALQEQRLHHAVLFCGSFGTGKTTLARILAKCLNCEQGISAHPCGTCSHCLAMDAGQSLDVLEIDAASRTKVEDTRELLESAYYPPVQARFKIFIIDEVHMLSGHSFNALLKTLEEPPPHVKFIFATTELQKLPATVLSRCLQFHLKPIPATLIVEHLAHILKSEGIEFEPKSLEPIAESARGSLRDALSLLEQALGFCHPRLHAEGVRAMLGYVDPKFLEHMLQALAERNGAKALELCKNMAEQGVDFHQVLDAMIRCFYGLSVQAVYPDAVLPFDLPTLSCSFSAEDLQLYYQIALIGRRDLAHVPDERLGFEMTVLRWFAFTPTAVSTPSLPPAPDAPKNSTRSAQERIQQEQERLSASHEALQKDPSLRSFLDIFDGKIASITPMAKPTETA